jgi:nucleotide-binding universal stress UspA family protein
MNELCEKYSKGREKVFEEYQELAERESAKIKTELVIGNPGKEIIKFSLKSQSDVIVMGNRGTGRLKEMFLGSVSNMVVRDTKCPVLLVK